MDAFYVSVELQRRPELKGLPVVVAGTGPRAVVTTASYEARKFGVFSATPAARARAACPQAVFLPPDFELYRSRSRDVMARSARARGAHRGGGPRRGLPRPQRARAPEGGRAGCVKEAVRERTGLCCSIGIGPSKLVAKVASDAEKPDGFVVLIARAGLRALRRVAARARARASAPRRPSGWTRAASARWASWPPRPTRRCRSGSAAARGRGWRALARFDDEREVTEYRKVKSESKETTFDRDLRGLDALEPVLARLADQLTDDLRRKDRRGRTIGIKVRLDDFSIHTRARTLPAPTNDPEVVRELALELLRGLRRAAPGAAGGRPAWPGSTRSRRGPDGQLALL